MLTIEHHLETLAERDDGHASTQSMSSTRSTSRAWNSLVLTPGGIVSGFSDDDGMSTSRGV